MYEKLNIILFYYDIYMKLQISFYYDSELELTIIVIRLYFHFYSIVFSKVKCPIDLRKKFFGYHFQFLDSFKAELLYRISTSYVLQTAYHLFSKSSKSAI